jgi:hypothetical protein
MTRRRSSAHLAAAMAKNATSAFELGAAAQTVVGARLAMGMQAAQQPSLAHVEEAARMTSEKVMAFGEAAAASAPGAARMGHKLAQASITEASAAMTAGFAVARAADPVTAAEVGVRYASDAMWRAMDMWTSLAGTAVGAQTAALAPIHRTATRNARRLKGR